jgi:hypothetical protein
MVNSSLQDIRESSGHAFPQVNGKGASARIKAPAGAFSGENQ